MLNKYTITTLKFRRKYWSMIIKSIYLSISCINSPILIKIPPKNHKNTRTVMIYRKIFSKKYHTRLVNQTNQRLPTSWKWKIKRNCCSKFETKILNWRWMKLWINFCIWEISFRTTKLKRSKILSNMKRINKSKYLGNRQKSNKIVTIMMAD